MSVISYSESGWDTQEDEDSRWDGWDDEEEMNAPMKCLFCPGTFLDTSSLFEHVKQTHGFDFLRTKAKLNLDFYQSMRLVNYVRTMSFENNDFGRAGKFSVDGSESFLSDDAYLKPAIEDDTLLYALDELDLDDYNDELVAASSDLPETTTESDLMARIKELEHQLRARQQETELAVGQLEDYKQMVKRQFYDTLATGNSSNSRDEENEADGSNYYFNSYAGNDIHLQMLQDKVRTEGYRDFIYDCKNIFAGKTVLDVGCGTGILSMFAARAGAARVIAVDNSDIIDKARANVLENKLDGVITLVRGKIEELELPVDKVDIIVSEWMGYFLLFEAMLDSVLVARDKYLAPGGLLAPSASYIYLTAISDPEYIRDSQMNYWDDVYGFKMSAMKPQGKMLEAGVDVVPSNTVMATRALVAEIDHGTVTAGALDFSNPFTIVATRDASVHALLGYFDVAFSCSQENPGPSKDELDLPAYDADASSSSETPIPSARSLWRQPESPMHGFTTGPHGIPTHWKQTIFALRQPIAAKKGDRVCGQFTCKKSTTNPRELDLEITYQHIAADGSTGEKTTLGYQLQ